MFYQLRVPLSISGRDWPIGHFLSCPRVIYSLDCLQNPRHLSTFMSLLMWCHFLSALLTLPKLALLKSAYHQYLKQGFFFLSFQEPFLTLPYPTAWESQGAQFLLGTPLCVVLKALESLYCTVSLCVLADCPSCPCGLLIASNLCPSHNSVPGTTLSLEPTGGQGHKDPGVCTSVTTES